MSVRTARADLARDLATAEAAGDVENAVRAVLVAIDEVRDTLGWRRLGEPTAEQREALGAPRAATIVAEAAAIVWPDFTETPRAVAEPAEVGPRPDRPP